jgi:DNA-binding IclR family transcriptional regulator
VSQTVERALTLLEFIAEEPRTLGQLAARLDVHKSTASRLAQTLEVQGFVRRDDHNVYRLGSRLFSLAFDALAKVDVRRVAAPHLRRLGELTGQTIHLAVLEGQEAFYVDKYESPQSVRMYSRIGRQAPLHCTGVAKAILAFRPLEEQRTLAQRITFTPYTKHTITTPAALLAELEKVRARGYAYDDREHEDFVHCIAAPIAMPDGDVKAAVSIATTTMSVTPKQLLDMVPHLLEAALAIQKDLA